jgi:hypothetical protein
MLLSDGRNTSRIWPASSTVRVRRSIEASSRIRLSVIPPVLDAGYNWSYYVPIVGTILWTVKTFT